MNSTTTCEFLEPRQIEKQKDSNNQDIWVLVDIYKDNIPWAFTEKECVTITDGVTSTSTGTSTASSTDWSVQPVFTGGDILLITFNFIFLAVIIAYFVIKSLAAIKVHKKYLQYHGGDVEVRDDL